MKPGIVKVGKKKNSIVQLIVFAVIIVALLLLPFWGRIFGQSYDYIIFIVGLMGVYITLGQMWNLLAGYSGLVSLGLQMFIGVGAYVLALVANYWHVPLVLGLFMGGAVAMVIGVGLSYLLLRMRGMYFAIASWMFAQAAVLVIVLFPLFGKGLGLFITPARQLDNTQKYYFSVVMFIVVTIVFVILLRSKLGLGLLAIRDNDTASQTSGVPLFRSKLICMMISSFITGVAGGVYYISQVWVQPLKAFDISWTVAVVFIVVIGGIGTTTGPIIGGVIYVFLSQYLATLSQIGSLNMVILGVIAVAVILAAPKGIVGTLQNRFGFEIISVRRWMMKNYSDRLPDASLE
ncbi:MAG: branched-chain amino acid ABC transporter permease [Clostridiales bacterium]|nr:branched-chain amino acid ABC transporter permease [Clostridiales bacterium]